MTADTSAAFFEGLYQSDPDPWNFATDAYEQARYDAILRTIAEKRFQRAFEPGCSVGVLTEGLASICDEVCSIDISPSAVESARKRCRALANVDIQCGALPYAVPSGDFDLIVFSEIGYYFKEEQLNSLAAEFIKKLRQDGVLLAAHWLGHSKDHLLSGDRVHQLLNEKEGLKHDYAERREEHGPGFRLDRWKRL
jgi:SAM-dependent methyltransferase